MNIEEIREGLDRLLPKEEPVCHERTQDRRTTLLTCPDCGESPGYCREVGDFGALSHDYGDDEEED